MSEEKIATLSEIESMPEFQDGSLSSFIGLKPQNYNLSMDDINRQFSVTPETLRVWSERPEDDWFTRQGKGIVAGAVRTGQSVVDLWQKGKNLMYRHTFPSADEEQARKLIELGMRQSTNRAKYRASLEHYNGTDDSIAANISAAFGSALEYVGIGLAGGAIAGPAGALTSIGLASGVQTTFETAEEYAQKYIEQTGDYSLKGYDRTNDAIAAGYGAVSGFIESALGIESVLAGGFKKLGFKPVMRKLALGGVEEGAEEFLQESLGGVAGKIAGLEDRNWKQILADSLESAAYGALVGGTLGGGMYMYHRNRLTKRLSERYGLDDSTAKNFATTLIGDVASQTEKEASTVVALQEHFGSAFDSLVGKVESALDAAGWDTTQIDPKTKEPYSKHEYAKAVSTDIAFQVLRQARINKVPVSDVLDLAEIESIDNVLYLRPQKLGTKAEIQNTIKEKKAEKKRLTDLAKTGAGDPARKAQLNTQIAVLDKLLDRINYKEQAQQQARPQELKDRSNLAKQDVKTLKKSTDVMDFYNKIPEANRRGLTLPNGQPDMLAVKRRHNDSKLMWLCNGDTNLFESLTEIGSTGTKVVSGINNVIDNVYQFAKDNPDIDFRSDIKGALERLVQIANKPNFAEFVSNPSTTDIFGQNALLYAFNFGSTEDITTFLNNFMDKANTNKQDGKFESGTFDKNDLYSQCLKMFDSAFDGDVATDPNMRAVMLSKETEKSTSETLFQEEVADLTSSFDNIKSADPTEVAEEVERQLNSLIGVALDTKTKPLQIQLTEDNKGHVKKTNLKLTEKQLAKHNTALLNLKQIANNAVKTEKDGTVDTAHNTRKKTIKHKANVAQYVYFESPIKIRNNLYTVELHTEQVKGQDPNLLDLYHVRVKYQGNAQLSTLSPDNTSIISPESRKVKQFEIIQQTNPMTDDYHVGIRSIDDIKTFDEIIDDKESFVWGDYSREDAKRDLEKGTVTVYSSHQIEQGAFVSTSRNMARDYAGGKDAKIYQQEVPITDVAWINGDEGQLAVVETQELLEQGSKKQGAYDPELQVIIIGRDFNTGTLPHEMAHFWLDDIFKRAKTYNDWTPEFVEQANNLFAILGVEENQTSLTVEQQEKFARMVENVVFGLQSAPDGAELPTLAYLNWVPEKYKSVIDIRYKGQDGAFHYPLLDKQSADFFNAWYSNANLPGLGASPLDRQNENFTDKNGETVPSTPEIMKLRENEQQKAVDDQTKVDDEMHNIGMQNTATDTQAAITGYNTDVARNITTPEPVVEPQPKKKSLLRIGRGTNTRAEMIEEAQKYIEKNKEHAEEIAFGDPELVENDSGIERGILIREVMNNYNKGSQEYSTLYDNLARTMSLAGKTGGLNNDIQVRFYLDGYSRLNRAMEAKAAAKYAGSNRGAITKFNQDIQKFIASKADAILATEPGSKERNNLIDSMLKEAEIKFAGGTGDARMLFQENNFGQKARRQNKADFLKWADKEIKKMLKANPESDPDALSKLITLSEKAQVARTQLDSKNKNESVSAAQVLREWQAYTDSLDDTVLDNQISKFNRGFRKIVGSWQPFAMLTNLNTHANNLVSNTVNLAVVESSLFAQYGKSDVNSSLIKAESDRIWAIYNSTQIDISQMLNPATPSLLHGEKIDVTNDSKLRVLDTRMWLGKEDLLFRSKVYLSTLAHIATKNAKASGKSANELFQEYCKLNQEAGSEAEQARQQAVLMGNIATFTQNGKLSGMLQKVRTEINKLTDPTGKAGFGTMLAPFLKTPANIVELGVRATVAPITDIVRLYQMARGTSVWGVQDTLSTIYFILALGIAAALDDYEPEYEAGKKYNPKKPYDSITFGGNAWIKLDLFGAMETPVRFLAALKTNKGLGISGAVSATPLIGDVAESVSSVERASKSGEKLLNFGINYAYNQVNKSVPAIIKQTMNLANAADLGLEDIDIGIKTGIGRKLGRQYGLDAQERTDTELLNDVLGVFFNRLKFTE